MYIYKNAHTKVADPGEGHQSKSPYFAKNNEKMGKKRKGKENS